MRQGNSCTIWLVLTWRFCINMAWRYRFSAVVSLTLLLLCTCAVLAQDEARATPTAVLITDFNFEFQGWNNCGPATLTNALTHFGYRNDQNRAANWLKPNREDKNVTPQEMVDFVNNEVPELPVRALARSGGDLQLLRQFIAAGHPVIVEKGYEPPPGDLGWMGHYLLMIGYDDDRREFTVHDSYRGPQKIYSYDQISEYWQHFNNSYIVLFESVEEQRLLAMLGEDADPRQNILRTLEQQRLAVLEDPENPFLWFNIGSNYVALAPDYGRQAWEYATLAFDEARRYGLPFRMLWYQFGPLEAYNAVGRYQDTLTLANVNLNDGGGHFVEEIWYHVGKAREGMGQTRVAAENYRRALEVNRNFSAAREALEALQAG